MNKKRLQLNVAITMFEKLNQPQAKLGRDERGNQVVDYVLESEKELNQFGIELKGFPANVEAVKEVFKDLERMMLHELSRLGLIK